MEEVALTKVEINLPITIKTSRLASSLLNLFTDTEGIGGCTYTTFAIPSVFNGRWRNPQTNELKRDNIMLIWGCYDIKRAPVGLTDLVQEIKSKIENEGGQKLAWVTYSVVSGLVSG